MGAAAARAAGLGRLAVLVAVRLRRPRRIPGEAARAGDGVRAGGVRPPGALLGRRLGGVRGHGARFPTRSGSTASGARSAGTPPTAACGCSGTSRSTSPQRGADAAAHPELFQKGVIAGAPPDALSSVGQLWGNPLYDWRELQAQGYRWWVERLRRTFELYDLARIDHFRGFVSYWSVPEGNRTAKRGRWRRGPGAELFRAAERELGRLPLVAEDLGLITPRGAPPPRRARDPGNGGDAVRVRGATVERPPAREPPPACGRLRRHARLRHRARLVAHALPPRARARRACRARSRTGS